MKNSEVKPFTICQIFITLILTLEIKSRSKKKCIMCDVLSWKWGQQLESKRQYQEYGGRHWCLRLEYYSRSITIIFKKIICFITSPLRFSFSVTYLKNIVKSHQMDKFLKVVIFLLKRLVFLLCLTIFFV